MRILLLEDDAELGAWISQSLNQAGHIVDWYQDGQEALQAAQTHAYDVLILDRLTPSLDGLSVLKALRAAKILTPVLMLTALSDVPDRVQGLEAGADDYLGKPFAMSELQARLQALVRRQALVEEVTVLHYGDTSLDLVKRQCYRQGQLIDLNAKEFLLLEVFLRQPHRLITKTMLLEQVWDLHFDPTTSVVETHLSRLRAKIEKPFGDSLIRTVRGAGYVLES